MDTIESEVDIEDKLKQPDIDIMRLALGSEELLKYSTRTFQQNNSISSPGTREKFNNSAIELDQNASQSQDGQTLFTRHPFKEFTYGKFMQVLKKMDIDKLMKMRKNALEYKYKIWTKQFEKMFKKGNDFSQRDYESKKVDLNKWMEREKRILKKD